MSSKEELELYLRLKFLPIQWTMEYIERLPPGIMDTSSKVVAYLRLRVISEDELIRRLMECYKDD